MSTCLQAAPYPDTIDAEMDPAFVLLDEDKLYSGQVNALSAQPSG